MARAATPGPCAPRLAAWVAARPRRALALSLLATLLALWPASRLRFEADLLSLLPEGSPAADGYRTFEEVFGGTEKVFVLIRLGAGEEPPEEAAALLLEAAEDLRTRLAASPEVAAARAGIEAEEEAFFLEHVVPRAPLLLRGDWRPAVEERLRPEAVRRRVARIRASLATPAGSLEATLATRDPLGFLDELPELGPGAATLPLDPLTLGFLSERGDASLLILTPARAELDPAAGRLLESELERAFAATRAAVTPDLRFHAVGGPLYAAQDERILRVDLQRTIAGSIAGCALLLLVAFEGVLLPAAALAAVGLGLAWTAGWIGLALSPVTAVGVGFAAVLVGLGLDYSIHGGARYRQHLLRGEAPAEALGSTHRHAGPALVTSALTTAAAFSVLGLAHFRPLRELGLVVAGGILAILLATAVFGSALLLLPRRRPPRQPGRAWRLLGRASQGLVELAERRPRWVLALALALSALGLWGLRGLRLDTDPAAFRPFDHPAREAERLLVESFKLGLDTTTVVLSAPDLDEVLARAERVEEILRRELDPGLDLTSPIRWLRPATELEARLEAAEALPFAAAAERLEAELRRAGLAPAAFAPGLEALRALGHGEDPAPLSPADWPAALGELLRLAPASAHAALRLRLPEGSWPTGPPPDLLARLEEAAPGACVASVPAIGAELGDLARRDLRRLSLLALAAVGLVVGLSFRGSPRPALLAMLPVGLGSLWTLGLWGLAGRSIDLLSLAVVPIMLGIGIDDGLHALHGSGPGARQLGRSVRDAARAMLLTSLTTCVGFGSLTLSRVPGLTNGGLLVALGVVACLAATLMVLPALGRLFGREGGPAGA